MRDFFVLVSAPGFPTQWVTVRASSQTDARSQITRNGWSQNGIFTDIESARQAFPNDSRLVGDIAGETPDFQRFNQLPNVADSGGGQTPDDPIDVSDTDTALNREAFEFGPGFEAGLRQRGINIGPGGGLTGRVAASQQRPLIDRFFTQEALTPGSALTEETAFPTLENFLSGTNTGTGNFTNELFGQGGALANRNLLNQARGFGTATGNFPSDLAGQVLNPATVSEGQILANVARGAGKQRFGSLARFLPSAQQLSNSFLSDNQLNPAGAPLSFADFLNQRIFG